MTGLRSNDRMFSTTQFRRLSDEQCQKIHWASLEVMERTGVRLYEQEAIDLLEARGAESVQLSAYRERLQKYREAAK